MTSPRLLHYAARAKIQGSLHVHATPIQSPYLLGPDELTIRHAKADRRLLFGIIAWVALLAVGLWRFLAWV